LQELKTEVHFFEAIKQLNCPYFTGKDELGTKVCRYNWHSAGSLGWLFPMLKYKYIFFQTK